MANLRAIAASAPILNKRAADRQREAQEFQFMDALAAAPVQPDATAAAQRIAPQMAASVAETQAKAQAATQQALGQAAEGALSQEGAEQGQRLAKESLGFKTGLADATRGAELSELQKDLESRKKMTSAELKQKEELSKRGIDLDTSLSFMTLKQREDLAKLGSDLNDELFQSRLAFDTSENKRRFTNARQLSDFKIANAKNDVEFRAAARELKQAADFDVQFLNAISKKAQVVIDQRMREAVQKGDQATQRQLADISNAFKKRQAAAAADAARVNSIIAVGATAATILGGVVGGPAGAAGGNLAVNAAGENYKSQRMSGNAEGG